MTVAENYAFIFHTKCASVDFPHLQGSSGEQVRARGAKIVRASSSLSSGFPIFLFFSTKVQKSGVEFSNLLTVALLLPVK